MQFNITLQCQDANPVIPINYQYELSAWVYKVIQHADSDYANFLHTRGYQTPALKSFKLFCFSQLDVPKRRIEGDRLYIECREVHLHIAFFVDKAAEDFIRGLFQQQQFRLGDKISQTHFTVQTIEMQPMVLPAGNEPVHIKLLSPLVVARKRPDNQPDEYLSPDDPDYDRLLLLNLTEKYAAATGKPIPVWWDSAKFGFRVVGQPPRSQLIKIKSGTGAETRVKGYRFEFELDAPRELIEVGLLAGFGRENAMGFGFGIIKQSKRSIHASHHGGDNLTNNETKQWKN